MEQRIGSDLVTAAWTYLVFAGLFEIGWPMGLKWAQEAQELRATILGIAVAVVSMTVSGALLYLAQREIALGTSYAVWTGIGAAGTFLIGVWFFGDPNGLGRWFGAALIVARALKGKGATVRGGRAARAQPTPNFLNALLIQEPLFSEGSKPLPRTRL